MRKSFFAAFVAMVAGVIIPVAALANPGYWMPSDNRPASELPSSGSSWVNELFGWIFLGVVVAFVVSVVIGAIRQSSSMPHEHRATPPPRAWAIALAVAGGLLAASQSAHAFMIFDACPPYSYVAMQQVFCSAPDDDAQRADDAVLCDYANWLLRNTTCIIGD